MPVTTEQRRQLREHLVPAIDALLEAARRGRKPRDVNALYTTVQRELRTAWKEQLADFKREWSTAAIRRTFDRKTPGPSATQMDALWNRCRKRGDRRMAKALDAACAPALERGMFSAVADLNSEFAEAKKKKPVATVDLPTVSISFDLDHPTAVKYLKKLGAQRVSGVSETSRNRIKRLVIQMAAEGKSYGEIGKAIEALVQGWTKKGVGAYISRGELIAVTEVGNAYEAGRTLVMNDMTKAGVKMKKSWIDVEDDRVCSICRPAGDQGWISSEKNFSNGLASPLGHPGCRCDLAIGADV